MKICIRFLQSHRLFLALLFFGILLRTIYVLGTPHSVREHDVWGHIDYIRYVAEHWSIPPTHANSQFYHPPLYYFLMAPFIPFGQTAGWTDDQTFFAIQLCSLFFSWAVLFFGLWIGEMLFPEQHHAKSFFLFGMMVATFPSLIFFAARINNDVLYHLFAFGGFAVLLQYWKNPSLHLWIIWATIVGVGMLAKTHVALLVPVACGCLLFQQHLSWKRKIQRLIFAGCIIALLGGWFHIQRYMDEGNARTTVLGNVNVLTNFVEESPRAFLTFNPVQILRHPFNNPFDDSERRQFFWEYFFRSAFFGEFSLDPGRRLTAQTMLFSALILLSFILLGIRRGFMHHFHVSWPLLWSLVILLVAHTAFRWWYPYSSCQDFRYSILLVIPIAYFLSLPEKNRVMAMTHDTFVLIFCASSTAIILSLGLS